MNERERDLIVSLLWRVPGVRRCETLGDEIRVVTRGSEDHVQESVRAHLWDQLKERRHRRQVHDYSVGADRVQVTLYPLENEPSPNGGIQVKPGPEFQIRFVRDQRV